MGAGMVSELHAAAISRARDARLVGFFEPDDELAGRRAREWSCRAYPDLETMLASGDLDAVFVLSPSAFHVEHARAALTAGKHVLVEKPVGRRPAEVRALMRLAERRGLVCLPGHNYAYIPEVARIRRLVRDGDLGTIRLLAVVFAVAHREDVASHYDGSVWLLMPHHVYIAHAILGMPASVSAGVTEPMWSGLEREDQSWFVLDYPPHTTAILFGTLGADDDSADPWSFVVKAVGSRGSASASWRAAVVRRAIGSMGIGWAPYEEAYEAELAAFVAAVQGDASLIASPMSDAVAVATIITAAERSVSTRRSVALRHDSTRS